MKKKKERGHCLISTEMRANFSCHVLSDLVIKLERSELCDIFVRQSLLRVY